MSQQEMSRRGATHPDDLLHAAAERPQRLSIASVSPSVAGGAYPSKRIVGDIVEIAAVVVCDGAAEIGAQVRLTDPVGGQIVVPMSRGVGYHFTADIPLTQIGGYTYVVEAWVDRAATMQSRIARKRTAGQPTANEEEELRLLGDDTLSDRVIGRAEDIVGTASSPRSRRGTRFFPRSTGTDGAPGTLLTSIDRLDYVAQMGFDILYIPPIHPIGRDHRKGINNSVDAEPGDVGSPWAIGAAEGGHTSVHPTSERSTTSTLWSPRPTSVGSRSQWTSPSNAAPTTPGSPSIRSGSRSARTAASPTRRTRPSAIRTSFRSTSTRSTGASCGPH